MYVCLFVHHMHVWCPGEGHRKMSVTWKLQKVMSTHHELNLGLLEQQQVPFAEPPLSTLASGLPWKDMGVLADDQINEQFLISRGPWSRTWKLRLLCLQRRLFLSQFPSLSGLCAQRS